MTPNTYLVSLHLIITLIVTTTIRSNFVCCDTISINRPHIDTNEQRNELSNVRKRSLFDNRPQHEYLTQQLKLPEQVAAGASGKQRELGQRIVGGTEVPNVSVYPSFGYDGSGCAATLIHPDMLLSVAHCYKAFTTGYPIIIGGLHQDGTDAIEKVYGDFEIQHPKFNPDTLNNDLMIIKLTQPTTKSPIQVLNFDSNVPVNNQNVTIIGFGNTKSGVHYSGNLRHVGVKVVPTNRCSIQLGGTIYRRTMICAGLASGGKDTCEGDSGGPLYIVQNSNNETTLVQVGITSFGGIGCGDKKTPGVYTRISNYEKWIKDTICENTSDTTYPDYCIGRKVQLSTPSSSPPPTSTPLPPPQTSKPPPTPRTSTQPPPSRISTPLPPPPPTSTPSSITTQQPLCSCSSDFYLWFTICKAFRC